VVSTQSTTRYREVIFFFFFFFYVAVAFIWFGRITKLADIIQSGALNNLAHGGSKPTTETRIARKS
jgi:hypothetical protein